MTNAVSITSDMVPELGGPYKTINFFSDALNGRILSFTNSKLLKDIDSNPKYQHVPVHKAGPVLPGQWKAGKEVVGNAELLTSHMLFRFHQYFTYRIARKTGIPYWVVPHGGLDPWVFTYRKTVKEMWWDAFGKRYFQHASKIICATKKERDKILQRYDGDNFFVQYWPTPMLHLEKRNDARIKIREKLGIPYDDRIMLYLGRYHSMKRPYETLEAFKKANLKGTWLVMIGIDYDITEKELSAMARDIPHSFVLGPKYGDEKEDYLLGADGMISLSWRENFNHGLAEGLAAGLVPVLSKGNDLGYDLPSELREFILDTDEVSEAVSKLEDWAQLTDEGLSDRARLAAEWANSNLSFDSFKKGIEGLLT